MFGKQLVWAGVFAVVLSAVVSSGDADAARCCRGRAGWRTNNGYYYNNGYYASNRYYNNNGYFASNGVVAPLATTTNNVISSVPIVNGQPLINRRPVLQQNGSYTVSKPVTNDYANPSPDVDNSAKNLTTSGIPGTQPAKAPEPPAAAAPRQQ